MTSIKPTGGPGGIHPPGAEGPDKTGGAERTGTRSFQDQVSGAQGPGAPGTAATTGPAGAQPGGHQAVIADLRAGRITPNEAVDRITDLAVRRSNAPPGMRSVVESRVREMLANDPLVRDLLRQMGASPPSDPSEK